MDNKQKLRQKLAEEMGVEMTPAQLEEFLFHVDHLWDKLTLAEYKKYQSIRDEDIPYLAKEKGCDIKTTIGTVATVLHVGKMKFGD